MKIVFIVYREVMEERIAQVLDNTGVDSYAEFENVKWKGHNAVPHLGTRTFPGLNCVRMMDVQDEDKLERLICEIKELNKEIKLKDDHIRLFQVPLERII